MEIEYGSVCSGIEAATLAWKPLGMRATWFAEIEPFPSAVLAHHYPNTPNLGDMTKLGAQVLAGKIAAPDLLVGGTPCQAFSVAGMREGLTDPRGALTIKYVELADAVDYVRAGQRKPACVVVWENVPGVLSDKGNAFGCFLGALAGEDCELQPSGKKWPDAGCVYGPKRTIAWRILDAQYFGLAQRRRRVFVVASARDGFDPTEVLFERDGVRRDYAPRLGEEENVASTIAGGARKRGGYSTDDIPLTAPTLRAQSQSSHRADSEAFIPVSAYGGGRTSGAIDVAACLTAKGMRIDFEVESFVVHGTQDPDVRIDQAHTLGRNNGMENAVLAFSCKDYGGDAGEISPTLRAMNHSGSHANGGGQVAIVASVSPTLRSGNMRNNSNPVTEAEMLVGGSKVRRLTPRECERLQGMPDDYTQIPWDGWRKLDSDETPEQCIADGMDVRQAKKSKVWYVRDADGPRYKAIGNSKAVPCVRWIGRRILLQINSG
ncbi:DNA cytosine methyltransferase [Pseudomonas sp. 22082]|uniref:DNA cytosine methyltransferase n=1 Tax=Pseudomonas sp. 22082 TaxID=3453868 RepID=UPI003F86E979